MTLIRWRCRTTSNPPRGSSGRGPAGPRRMVKPLRRRSGDGPEVDERTCVRSESNNVGSGPQSSCGGGSNAWGADRNRSTRPRRFAGPPSGGGIPGRCGCVHLGPPGRLGSGAGSSGLPLWSRSSTVSDPFARTSSTGVLRRVRPGPPGVQAQEAPTSLSNLKQARVNSTGETTPLSCSWTVVSHDPPPGPPARCLYGP